MSRGAHIQAPALQAATDDDCIRSSDTGAVSNHVRDAICVLLITRPHRYFEGIQGDKDMPGELFGIKNIFALSETYDVQERVCKQSLG